MAYIWFLNKKNYPLFSQSRNLQIVESSKTHFTVTPLEFVRNLDIEINADKVNGGVEDVAKINDKDKDLSVRFSNEIFFQKKIWKFYKKF